MRSDVIRMANAACRRGGLAAAGVVLVSAAVLTGAGTAAAATTVDCSTGSLRTAINNAASGAKLVVTGTCSGNFTISKNLTLLGQGTAVLNGQSSGTTLSVSLGATVNVGDLKFTNGFGFATAGGIFDSGALTVKDTVVSDDAGFLGGGVGGVARAR